MNNLDQLIVEQAFTKAASDVNRALESVGALHNMVGINKQANTASELLAKLTELASKAKGGIMDGVEAIKGFGANQIEAAKNLPEALKKLKGPGESGLFASLTGKAGNTYINDLDKSSLKQLAAALGIGGGAAGAGAGVALGKLTDPDPSFWDKIREKFASVSLEKQAKVLNYLLDNE